MRIRRDEEGARRESRALRRGAAALVALLVLPAVAQAECQPGFPPGLPSEDRVVPPGAPAGAAKTWYKVANYLDRAVPGQINSNDSFAFSVDGIRMRLADPSVLRIGPWFYITGTTDTDGRHTVNFEIYRTRNFRDFKLHMLAFNESGMRTAAGHWLTGGFLRFSNGRFNQLWAPQIYVDPTRPGRVHLVFAAVKRYMGESPEGHHSVYRATIDRDDFLAWHGQNPLTWSGKHFADLRSGPRIPGIPAGFFHRPNNDPSQPRSFNGGTLDKLIPAGGPVGPLLGEDCGDLREFLRRRVGHRCLHPSAWMSIDPFVFFDRKLGASHPWKRVMLYNWAEARGFRCDDERGNHIAAAPLFSNAQVDAGPEGGLVPLAVNRNVNNRIQNIDNGAVAGENTGSFHTWSGGGVAEGASAFYDPDTDRYYLIYSRNPVSSAAYQIVYRMTRPGQPFRALGLSSTLDRNVREHVLLRPDPNPPGGIRSVNFGHPEVFSLLDGSGQVRYYLIFHVKLEPLPGESGLQRTLFVKELTFEDDDSGRLKQLFEQSEDPDRDIHSFRMPSCHQPVP